MRLFFLALLGLISMTLTGQNSLSIMYYNLLNYPGTTAGRADTLRKIVQYIQPDMLVVNELSSEEGADIILSQSLNVYGIGHYKRALFTNGEDTDNMLFYDSTKVEISYQYEVETALRLINEYNLYVIADRPDTLFFCVYSAHLKSSQGSEEENLRLAEATAFKARLAEKTDRQNIIFGGDLNLYTSNEKAYDAITTAYDIELHDPIFTPGNWHNSSVYANIHTQSTRVAQFGGGASGGIDDRFDIMFVSTDVLTGENRLQYEKDSYTTIGQDGNRFNQSIMDPPNFSAPDSVISALYYMSDHLPIMMTLSVLDSASGVQELALAKFQIHYWLKGNMLYMEPIHQDICFKLFDISGRQLFDAEIAKGSNQIEIPNIGNGIYLLYFEDEESHEVFVSKAFLSKP